jgi:hypothetical protein
MLVSLGDLHHMIARSPSIPPNYLDLKTSEGMSNSRAATARSRVSQIVARKDGFHLVAASQPRCPTQITSAKYGKLITHSLVAAQHVLKRR